MTATLVEQLRVEELDDAIESDDRAAVMRLLRENPALANAKMPDGKTALQQAAHWDRAEIAQALIDGGADISAVSWVHTPLSWAVVMRANAVARVLLAAGAELDLWCAAGLGMMDAVKSYWDQNGNLQANPSRTGGSIKGNDGKYLPKPPPTVKEVLGDALYIAARNRRVGAVRWLLDHDADPNIPSYYGGTALHWAVVRNHVEVVDLLLKRGADPNLCWEDGAAALDIAVREGHDALAERLRRDGAVSAIALGDGL